MIPPTRLDAATLEALVAQMRNPDERRGDLRAQLAAQRLGERRHRRAVRPPRPARGRAAMDELVAYSERRVRAGIARSPTAATRPRSARGRGGRSSCPSRDSPATSWSSTSPARAAARRQPELPLPPPLPPPPTPPAPPPPECPPRPPVAHQTRADVDLSPSQASGPDNNHPQTTTPPCPLAVTRSACLYVVRCLTDPDVPASGGALAPLTRPRARGLARQRAPARRSRRRQRGDLVADRRRALPRLRRAAPGARAGPGDDEQRHPRQRALHVLRDDRRRPGRVPGADGPSAVHVAMSNTLNTPVEALELRCRCGSSATSSGAARAARGCTAAATASSASCARSSLPRVRDRGAPRRRAGRASAGGEAGRGRTLLNGGELPAKATVDLAGGDVLRIETPGGGGWGTRRVGSRRWRGRVEDQHRPRAHAPGRRRARPRGRGPAGSRATATSSTPRRPAAR